jgi:serine/threonine-protein kinase HipA
MRLARAAGLSTPQHGMLYGHDGRLCYFVRRFDRVGRSERLAVEDFAQLLGLDRDSKYESSMERVATVLDRFCTFPVLDKTDLLRRTLVCFLTGNEDMHLKNFSIVTGRDGIRRLSPCYDFVNTTIVLHNPTEELALPLAGKRSNLQRDHFLEYFGRERLGLSQRAVEDVVESIRKAQPAWNDLIGRSFLTDGRRDAYREMLADRRERLGFGM